MGNGITAAKLVPGDDEVLIIVSQSVVRTRQSRPGRLLSEVETDVRMDNRKHQFADII
jgi:hypothetical protein